MILKSIWFALIVIISVNGAHAGVSKEVVRRHVIQLLPIKGERQEGTIDKIYKWENDIVYKLISVGPDIEKEIEQVANRLRSQCGIKIYSSAQMTGLRPNFIIGVASDFFGVMTEERVKRRYIEDGESDFMYANRINNIKNSYSTMDDSIRERDGGYINYMSIINRNIIGDKSKNYVLYSFLRGLYRWSSDDFVIDSVLSLSESSFTHADYAFVCAYYDASVKNGGDAYVERKKIIEKMDLYLNR